MSNQLRGALTPLSVQLKQGTRRAHRIVEKVQFVRAFLKGLLHRASYLQYLRDLLLVYETLEQQLSVHARLCTLEPLFLPKLFRAESLRADLGFLQGKDWEQTLFPSASAKMFAQHLRGIARTEPYLLAAHAYTRYLGDLAGGQILKPMAKLALGLPGPEGLSFYEFPLVGDLAAMRTSYRQKLDGLPLSEREQQRMVQEACLSFEWNQIILSSLPSPGVVCARPQARVHVVA